MMRYVDVPDDLREAVDDLLEDSDFPGVLQALDGAIESGAEKERRRIAGLVELRGQYDNVPARDATIDRAIVDGGSAATTYPILDALNIKLVTAPEIDSRTRRFDRAILNGISPLTMRED